MTKYWSYAAIVTLPGGHNPNHTFPICLLSDEYEFIAPTILPTGCKKTIPFGEEGLLLK